MCRWVGGRPADTEARGENSFSRTLEAAGRGPSQWKGSATTKLGSRELVSSPSKAESVSLLPLGRWDRGGTRRSPRLPAEQRCVPGL